MQRAAEMQAEMPAAPEEAELKQEYDNQVQERLVELKKDLCEEHLAQIQEARKEEEAQETAKSKPESKAEEQKSEALTQFLLEEASKGAAS